MSSGESSYCYRGASEIGESIFKTLAEEGGIPCILGISGYAAANGEFSLTKEWAAELMPFGINVNAVVVAEYWTPHYEWWINQQPNPEGKLKEILSKIPLDYRMTTPEEIADTVLFLLSPNSKIINGQFFL